MFLTSVNILHADTKIVHSMPSLLKLFASLPPPVSPSVADKSVPIGGFFGKPDISAFGRNNKSIISPKNFNFNRNTALGRSLEKGLPDFLRQFVQLILAAASGLAFNFHQVGNNVGRTSSSNDTDITGSFLSMRPCGTMHKILAAARIAFTLFPVQFRRAPFSHGFSREFYFAPAR
jgi:hypothetical protein